MSVSGGLHRSFRPCRDFIVALVPLYAVSTWMYGLRVLILAGCAVATSFLCDLLSALVTRKRYDVTDISSYMYTLMFTALVPASVNYVVVIGISAFIVIIAKNAFGGFGSYPFNPTVFGFALASVCWGDEMFMYPKAFSEIGIGWDSGAAVSASVAHTLRQGGVPSIDSGDLLLGNYPGPLGTTFCVIIIACMFLFVAHDTITYHIPLAFLLTCAAWAVLFPRVRTGVVDSLLYELFSDSLIFSIVFLAAQPDTSPQKAPAKLIYGVALGVGSMFYRTFGAYDNGSCFAILLLSPLSATFDRMFSKKKSGTRGRRRAK